MPLLLACWRTICPSAMPIEVEISFAPHVCDRFAKCRAVFLLVLLKSSSFSLGYDARGGCILRMLRPRALSCLRASYRGFWRTCTHALSFPCWSRLVCPSSLALLSLSYLCFCGVLSLLRFCFVLGYSVMIAVLPMFCWICWSFGFVLGCVFLFPTCPGFTLLVFLLSCVSVLSSPFSSFSLSLSLSLSPFLSLSCSLSIIQATGENKPPL